MSPQSPPGRRPPNRLVRRPVDRGVGRRNRSGSRRVEASAISALIPVVAMVPFFLLASFVIWLPIRLIIGVGYWVSILAFLATGLLLFVRPFQSLVLTPLLGARRATAEEAARILPIWADIAEANHLPANRYVLRVLPSDELNAFACGGHLVLVTSFAAERLSPAQLRGVLAHELGHHLGLHTVAITVGHWLSIPVVLLARLGFFLENVGRAAADTYGRTSQVIEVLGRFAAWIFRALSWVFTLALRGGDALGNIVGHAAEFEADQRVVRMGFGPELASALRLALRFGSGERPIGWRGRLAASHPAARTRVARIEALRRHPSR